MGRYRLRYLYFMERYFFDEAHFFRYMEANSLGFKGSGAFAEFQFTKEEFLLAYANKRTRLPNGERLAWPSVTRAAQYRIHKIRNFDFGYQEKDDVVLADSVLNFIMHAPDSTFYRNPPFWFCTGVDWDTKAAIILKPEAFEHWIRREWKDELVMRFGITSAEIYERAMKTYQSHRYGWGYCLVPVIPRNI